MKVSLNVMLFLWKIAFALATKASVSVLRIGSDQRGYEVKRFLTMAMAGAGSKLSASNLSLAPLVFTLYTSQLS